MRFKILFTFFLFTSAFFISAQSFADLVPAHSKINIDSLKLVLKKNREVYMKSIQKEDPYIIMELRKDYDDRIKEIDELCKGGFLFWDDTLTHYLKNIVYKLQAGSPFIKKNIILMVTKTLVPNASSWGDNIIIINTGLLTKYENEAELAFVIGHELAHDYLDHIFKSAKTNYLLTKKLKFNRKYRRAQRAKYQTTNKINRVVEEYLTAVTSYGRKDEVQADSLGAVLIANTGYSYKNAVNSLAILETVDDAFFNDKLDLKKIFSGKDYPFNDSWLQKENLNEKIYKETLSDSLKTHPDCKDRIKVLISEFKIDTGKSPANKPIDIDFINQRAYFENMQSSYQERDYLLSLYHGLQLLKKHPQNDYITAIICGSMYHISYALKKHRFSSYIPLPHPDYDTDLNSLIAFLNNLLYADYKNLTKQFYSSHSENKTENASLKNAKFYCNVFDMNDGELIKSIKALNQGQKISTFDDILKEIGHEKK